MMVLSILCTMCVRYVRWSFILCISSICIIYRYHLYHLSSFFLYHLSSISSLQFFTHITVNNGIIMGCLPSTKKWCRISQLRWPIHSISEFQKGPTLRKQTFIRSSLGYNPSFMYNVVSPSINTIPNMTINGWDSIP